MTHSRSNGTNPAPRNPPRILLGVTAALKVRFKHGKNSSFVICVIRLRMSTSAWRLYALVIGEKQLTSSGCKSYDECGGIQKVIILLALQ